MGRGAASRRTSGKMALTRPPLDEGLGTWERTGKGLQAQPEGREGRIPLGSSAGQAGGGDFLRHPPER